MDKITIREALTEKDIEAFWTRLHEYHARDIFPNPEDEDREYFLDDNQYRRQIDAFHCREHDRSRYVFFQQSGTDIGFALAVIYDSEDGKCFLMEFCVYPEYRGKGCGSACAGEFKAWAAENGSKYIELNFDTEQRRRFWSRQGFVPNGCDEWGVKLMLLPPEERVPFTAEPLADSGDWQLHKLLCGFLNEIGEGSLDDEGKERLKEAVDSGKIRFFLAKRGCRAVGMCSVSTYWSSFSCGEVGVFDDFYIEPAFRRKGIAKLLVSAAVEHCRKRGLASLCVSCADCDVGMYTHLGFNTKLGTNLVSII